MKTCKGRYKPKPSSYSARWSCECGSASEVSCPEPKPISLQRKHDDLAAALQFGLDNMHKWTGTSGPGATEFIEQARAALLQSAK